MSIGFQNQSAKADEAYIALSEQLLDVGPIESGVDFPLWTINRLCHFLAEQMNCLLSNGRFRA